MPELRLNVVTNEWVILSSRRGRRPHDFKRDPTRPQLRPFSDACPFCPGNEVETARETFRLPERPDTPWRARVVLNKFPALSTEAGSPSMTQEGPRISVDGYGIHEVVIETPSHNLGIAQRTPSEVEDMLATYRSRYRFHADNPHVAQIIIFKNHGEGAGTSLYHPHSQLIALPVVPPQVQQRVHIMTEHLERKGGCLICETVQQEIGDEARILHDGEHFVAFIPYAALSAYHIWLMPKRHIAAFGDIGDDELSDLAVTLRKVLRMLYFGLDDPDFNFLIRSAPIGEHDFHWYLAIVPRVSKAAGFELGSGMYVNPQRPRKSASLLRNALSWESD